MTKSRLQNVKFFKPSFDCAVFPLYFKTRVPIPLSSSKVCLASYVLTTKTAIFDASWMSSLSSLPPDTHSKWVTKETRERADLFVGYNNSKLVSEKCSYQTVSSNNNDQVQKYSHGERAGKKEERTNQTKDCLCSSQFKYAVALWKY